MTIEKAEESLRIHARQAVTLLPIEEWPIPVRHCSPQRIRELCEQGEWRQVVYSIEGVGRSNILHAELAACVLDAREAISAVERLRTKHVLQNMSVEEARSIGQCLDAAANGPFFPDGEFHTLFGITRERAAEIARQWPSPDPSADDIGVAINNSFNNLLGYPHRKRDRWGDFISITPQQAAQLFERWRSLAGYRALKNEGGAKHFDHLE